MVERRSPGWVRSCLAMHAVAVGVVALAVVSLSGCSDGENDDAETSSSTRPNTTTTTTVPAIERDLAATTELPDDMPGYRVYRPVDLDATGRPLPVVVWANGGCVRLDTPWQAILQRWAEAGFVVVAITARPGVEPSMGDPSSVEDQGKAIDWAEAANKEPGGPYEGKLDLDRVAAAGNSCGGITSLALAGTDKRVRSVFILSGSSVGPGATREQAALVMDKVDIPVGFAVGGAEDLARPQAVQDISLLAPGVPGYIAMRSTGDHVTVSTDTKIQAQVAEIGINWLDVTLNANKDATSRLLNAPCTGCTPEPWTIDTKNLEA